jgi:hypothetical protein
MLLDCIQEVASLNPGQETQLSRTDVLKELPASGVEDKSFIIIDNQTWPCVDQCLLQFILLFKKIARVISSLISLEFVLALCSMKFTEIILKNSFLTSQ